MWDLFKGELLRFRAWVIAYAVLNLLLLGFLTRVVDLAQQPLMPVYRVFGGVYALTGLLLGLYQMGGYRRPNTWLNLLHRPLPRWQIAAALFGACAVLLALAIALPILTIAGWQEVMTARVVDTRHWLMALAALLIALCSYLAGGYCMLGGKRYAAAVLVLPLLLALSQASGLAALAVQGLVLVWLIVLVLIAFRPDLSAPPRRLLSVVATALPVQMSMYLLLSLLGFGYTMLWIAQGSHPNNSTPPRGGHNETERLKGKERMLAGLTHSSEADAPLLREQVALSEAFSVWGLIEVPVRNELTNLAPMEFDDNERRIRWVFSHDSMRLEGYSLADNRSVGHLGVGANGAAFETPVLPAGGLPSLPAGDSVLIGGGTLYHYNSETKQVLPRIRLPAGEILADATFIGENLGVLSDRALYFFDGRDVTENDLVMTPRQRVPMPGKKGDLSRLELIELIEGYLISFTFSAQSRNIGGATPYQQLLRVDDNGHVETIARHEFIYDYPALFTYREWWASPVMYVLYEGAKGLFADPVPLDATVTAPVPRSAKILAAALALLSLLGAIWLTRRQSLSLLARVAWVMACGLIGLPALLSLWLLYPKREQLDDLPITKLAAQPAAA